QLTPWQAKRILHNVGAAPGVAAGNDRAPVLRMEIDGTDPVTGTSFASIAARSRAMHKTQGFDRGGPGAAERKSESFVLLAGEPVTGDIFDGIDATWSRVPNGTPIGQMT